MEHKASLAQSPVSLTENDKQIGPNSLHDENENDATPRKRQRRSPAATGSSAAPMSKKGKACTACRKLKVKCDSAERSPAGCSRCQRLGLECVSIRRLNLNSEDGEAHPSIFRLNQAVEDILQRLEMPALETYSKPPMADPTVAVKTASEFQATRENSREPANGNDIAPAPMGSLYEVTQLNSLRSRLRNANPRQRSSRRNTGHDIVAQGLMSLGDAEELFELFKRSLARYLFAATIPENTVLAAVRESSALLFTAIMLVSALHIPGKESIHQTCHKQFLELIATSMFEPFHTLDDIRGLCIAAFWQPDLSWKLSGLCIRMATELNLHQAYYSAFYIRDINEEQRKIALEKARLWYLLYVLDHHFSIAYGRPPVTAELLPIKEYDTFVSSPWCTSSDRRLISQVSIFVILSKAFEVFGLEAERLMDSSDASISEHVRFTDDIRIWHDRWKNLLQSDKFIADYPSKGVPLHYHFSSLVLNSLALRGRPLESLVTLPQPLRQLARNAIEAAHSILQFFLNESSYRDSLVGIPLYLHSMIAFAVVFLIKMARHWHAIDCNVDPETQTKPLIKGVISTLRQCKASANHMVYNMAAGFERMLHTKWAPSATSGPRSNARYYRKQPASNDHTTRTYASNLHKGKIGPPSADDHGESSGLRENIHSNPNDPAQEMIVETGKLHNMPSDPDAAFYGHNQHHSGAQQNIFFEVSDSMYGIDLEYDMLWSAGMGYDLLHTNRQDLTLGDSGFGLGFFDTGPNAGTDVDNGSKVSSRGIDTATGGLP